MRTFNNLLPADKPKDFSDLRDLFRSSADVFGDRTLYYYKDDGLLRGFTYGDFYRSMKEFATALYAKGLDAARIAIVGDTHPYWVVAFTAIFSCGAVAVPLDRELDDAEMIGFMKRAKCTAVVYTGCMNDRLAAHRDDLDFIDYFVPINPEGESFAGGKVISFEDFLSEGRVLLENGDTRFEDHEIDMDKMSALLFTSGTTGSSKGVMLSHGNLTAAVRASCLSTQYGKDNRFVSVLPIHHTFELTTLQLAQGNLGGTVYINESLRYATRNFKEYKPDTLVLVPLFLETVHKKIWDEIRRKGIEKKVRSAMAVSLGLLKTGVDVREKFFSDITSAFGGRLRSIVVGGAPLDPQIVKDFYAFGITVLQGYGITECSPLVSVNRPGKVKFDTVGQSVEGCEVKIAPLDGSPDGEGEILVRGGNVMIGYYEDPEATEEAFTEDGFFRTGDIGILDRDGYLKITGRKKSVIIASNGKNVFPEELEERLMKLGGIKECVALQRGEEIVALIVPEDGSIEQKGYDSVCDAMKEGIAKINRNLPSYKHIQKFEIRTEEFEKTPTKKIKRFLLH